MMPFQSVLQKYASQQVFTHAAVAIGRLDRPGADQVFAVAGPQGNLHDTSDNSPTGILNNNNKNKELSFEFLFDLASLTKALVTSPLCFYFVKQQNTSFSSTVGEWLRASGGSNGSAHGSVRKSFETLSRLSPKLLSMTVGDLLRHTSGLPAWHNFHVNSEWEVSHPHLGEGLDEERLQTHARMIEKLNWIADHRLDHQPSHCYSDVGFILLGLCLEVTQNSRLDEIFKTFLKRLNFDSEALLFGPSLSESQIVKTVSTGHSRSLNQELVGLVHDENAASFGGVAPHAGLFGSVQGVSSYLRTLWQQDDQLGLFAINSNFLRNVLPPPSDQVTKADLPSAPPSSSATYRAVSPLLGWQQGSDDVARRFCQGLTLGHYGFTGTAFWIEPNSTKFVVLLTNRVHFGYFSKGIAACRQEIFTLAHQALQ